MHTFKNLVKHKRSSTCFCGTKSGGERRVEKKRDGERKEKITFKKIYYECACQVYECQVEFGSKPGKTVELKKLKGWPWKVCSQNRVSRPASRLSRYDRITTLFIHFDLSGMHARLLTKDLSSLRLLPVFSLPCLMPCAPRPCLSGVGFYWCLPLITHLCLWHLGKHWWNVLF